MSEESQPLTDQIEEDRIFRSSLRACWDHPRRAPIFLLFLGLLSAWTIGSWLGKGIALVIGVALILMPFALLGFVLLGLYDLFVMASSDPHAFATGLMWPAGAVVLGVIGLIFLGFLAERFGIFDEENDPYTW